MARRNVRVLPALLSLAVGPAGLRDVDHLLRLIRIALSVHTLDDRGETKPCQESGVRGARRWYRNT